MTMIQITLYFDSLAEALPAFQALATCGVEIPPAAESLAADGAAPANVAAPAAPAKRGPGRPRKNPLEALVPQPATPPAAPTPLGPPLVANAVLQPEAPAKAPVAVAAPAAPSPVPAPAPAPAAAAPVEITPEVLKAKCLEVSRTIGMKSMTEMFAVAKIKTLADLDTPERRRAFYEGLLAAMKAVAS